MSGTNRVVLQRCEWCGMAVDLQQMRLHLETAHGRHQGRIISQSSLGLEEPGAGAGGGSDETALVKDACDTDGEDADEVGLLDLDLLDSADPASEGGDVVVDTRTSGSGGLLLSRDVRFQALTSQRLPEAGAPDRADPFRYFSQMVSARRRSVRALLDSNGCALACLHAAEMVLSSQRVALQRSLRAGSLVVDQELVERTMRAASATSRRLACYADGDPWGLHPERQGLLSQFPLLELLEMRSSGMHLDQAAPSGALAAHPREHRGRGGSSGSGSGSGSPRASRSPPRSPAGRAGAGSAGSAARPRTPTGSATHRSPTGSAPRLTPRSCSAGSGSTSYSEREERFDASLWALLTTLKNLRSSQQQDVCCVLSCGLEAVMLWSFGLHSVPVLFDPAARQLPGCAHQAAAFFHFRSQDHLLRVLRRTFRPIICTSARLAPQLERASIDYTRFFYFKLKPGALAGVALARYGDSDGESAQPGSPLSEPGGGSRLPKQEGEAAEEEGAVAGPGVGAGFLLGGASGSSVEQASVEQAQRALLLRSFSQLQGDLAMLDKATYLARDDRVLPLVRTLVLALWALPSVRAHMASMTLADGPGSMQGALQSIFFGLEQQLLPDSMHLALQSLTRALLEAAPAAFYRADLARLLDTALRLTLQRQVANVGYKAQAGAGREPPQQLLSLIQQQQLNQKGVQQPAQPAPQRHHYLQRRVTDTCLSDLFSLALVSSKGRSQGHESRVRSCHFVHYLPGFHFVSLALQHPLAQALRRVLPSSMRYADNSTRRTSLALSLPVLAAVSGSERFRKLTRRSTGAEETEAGVTDPLVAETVHAARIAWRRFMPHCDVLGDVPDCEPLFMMLRSEAPLQMRSGRLRPVYLAASKRPLHGLVGAVLQRIVEAGEPEPGDAQSRERHSPPRQLTLAELECFLAAAPMRALALSWLAVLLRAHQGDRRCAAQAERLQGAFRSELALFLARLEEGLEKVAREGGWKCCHAGSLGRQHGFKRYPAQLINSHPTVAGAAQSPAQAEAAEATADYDGTQGLAADERFSRAAAAVGDLALDVLHNASCDSVCGQDGIKVGDVLKVNFVRSLDEHRAQHAAEVAVFERELDQLCRTLTVLLQAQTFDPELASAGAGSGSGSGGSSSSGSNDEKSPYSSGGGGGGGGTSSRIGTSSATAATTTTAASSDNANSSNNSVSVELERRPLIFAMQLDWAIRRSSSSSVGERPAAERPAAASTSSVFKASGGRAAAKTQTVLSSEDYVLGAPSSTEVRGALESLHSALDLEPVFGRELQASAAPLPLELPMGVVRGSPFSFWSRVVETATSALDFPEILIDSLLRTANLVEANSLFLPPAPQDALRTIRVVVEHTIEAMSPEDPWRSLLAEAGARFQSRAAAHNALRRAAAAPGAAAAPPAAHNLYKLWVLVVTNVGSELDAPVQGVYARVPDADAKAALGETQEMWVELCAPLSTRTRPSKPRRRSSLLQSVILTDLLDPLPRLSWAQLLQRLADGRFTPTLCMYQLEPHDVKAHEPARSLVATPASTSLQGLEDAFGNFEIEQRGGGPSGGPGAEAPGGAPGSAGPGVVGTAELPRGSADARKKSDECGLL